MTRKVYPSDISREQFEAIREMLENARKKTNPRRVDLYEIFCAILYLLREGCRWRPCRAISPRLARCVITSTNGAPKGRRENRACWSGH